MACFSTCSCYIKRHALTVKRNVLSIQGHYINRNRHHNKFLGHCQSAQIRNFLSFPNTSRKREHCGRQLVGYTMEQFYNVVSDVENYHRFLPWCKQSIILKRSTGHLQADLIIGFPPINESYTSSVTLVKPHLVKAECTDGRLFHHLLSIWRFSPGLKKEQQSCVVDFQLTFEFRSVFYSNLSDLFFEQVVRQMEGAFTKEVARRYGAAKIPSRNLLLSNQQTLKS